MFAFCGQPEKYNTLKIEQQLQRPRKKRKKQTIIVIVEKERACGYYDLFLFVCFFIGLIYAISESLYDRFNRFRYHWLCGTTKLYTHTNRQKPRAHASFSQR